MLVEKPITTGGARPARSASSPTGAGTLMGHTFIYNAGVAGATTLQNGDAGDVYYLYARRTALGPIRRT